MSVVITEVKSKSDKLKFVKFPIGLYKGNPYFVPPLVLDELETINPKKNPAFDFCEQQLFLAHKDGKIVGRIAAIINHSANEIWKQKNVRFSFVDFIDDNEVVDALFAAAEKWGKEMGMDTIQGPMGYTDLDREGLLIEGYDRISTMATSYSFPYYKEQIERLGFEKDVDWQEFYIPVPEHFPERHLRIAKIVSDKYGLKVLKFKNSKQIKPYIDKVFKVLNQAYEPLYGFAPLTQRQIDHYVKMYIPLLNWDIVTIIIEEATDNVVGFGIAVPNLSRALQKSNGKLFPFGWIHLWRNLKGKNNKVADLMLMGVAPEYQGKGVNAMIFIDFIQSTQRCGFEHVESNPELEINNKMTSLWDGFNAVNHKRRRAYLKKI